MSDGLRRCSICGQGKPTDEFRKLKNGRSSHCKPCAAAYLRDWRLKNKERLREQRRARTLTEDREKVRQLQRESYARNPEAYRDSRLRSQFGITLAQYRDMEAAQDSKCAICGEKCKTGRSLAVDHNHSTGEVRGLLCANCNRAIGLLQEDPDRLAAAAMYLLRFQDVLKEIGQ